MTPDQQPGWQVISEVLSSWIVPALILFIITYAYFRKVKVYEVFVEGAKDGFSTAVMIIPYLVTIFAAIALFRAGGALEIISNVVATVIAPTILPPEVIMMSFMKPMSGSGARGLMIDVFNQYGVDSYPGFLASAIQGSTETTFYVIAVYFGAVGVKNARHTIAVGLIAEFVAITVAVVLSYLWWNVGK
ncbi:MAG: spore maturation protein [Candidatus Sumerlaeaceae bacterium]